MFLLIKPNISITPLSFCKYFVISRLYPLFSINATLNITQNTQLPLYGWEFYFKKQQLGKKKQSGSLIPNLKKTDIKTLVTVIKAAGVFCWVLLGIESIQFQLPDCKSGRAGETDCLRRFYPLFSINGTLNITQNTQLPLYGWEICIKSNRVVKRSKAGV